MFAKRHLKNSTALIGILSALSMGGAAFAQDQDFGEDDETIEQVVITGSYVRRKSQANSPSPIAVLGAESIGQIGASTIRDITQTLTINNGAQNNPDAFTQNLTTGTENINLRGLGVQSTLVLLNSKRQVSSASPTDGGLLFVDTASLVPLIAVDRVEILKDGAAALYGTDAVAGVANFITRDDFEGIELEVDYQAVVGDGEAADIRASGIVGGGNERAHVVASVSYLDRSPLTSRERDLRRGFQAQPGLLSVSSITALPGNFIVPTSLALQITNPALVPAYTAAFDQVTPFAAPGVLNLDPMTGAFLGFLPASDGIADGLTAAVLQAQGVPGAILSQIAGAIAAEQTAALQAGQFTSFSNPVIPDPNCGDIAGALDQDVILATPQPASVSQVGLSQLGQCVYDFGPFFNVIPEETRLQGFAQGHYDITDQIQFYGEFGFARNRVKREISNFPITQPISLPDNYPFNPFGPGTLFVGRSPTIGQITDFFTDSPNPGTVDYDTYRVQAGVRGDISESWSYDVSYVRGINDWKLVSSDGLRNEFFLAINGLGGPDCNPSSGVPGVGNCQYYNVFGSGAIADPSAVVPVLNPDFTPFLDPNTGQPVLVPVRNSQEILEFLVGDIVVDGDSDITVVDAIVTGDLFELDAGTIGLALGFQYRDERLAQEQDLNTQAGNFLFVTAGISPFDQSRDVIAFFGEINIPIMDNLEVNGAVRYEDYGGQTGDTLDPKVSILYQPDDRITLRGSWGTSFRAPSLFQQFGSQTTLNSVNDPLTGQAPFLSQRVDGNLALVPEESRTFNVGVTAEPVDGLELNVDYWNFKFTDIITQFSPQTLVNLCAAGMPLPAGTDVIRLAIDSNGDGRTCDEVGTNLLTITTIYTNEAFIRTDGIDFAASYTWDAGNLGIVRAGFEGTYILNYEIPDGQGGTFEAVDRRNDQNFASPVPDFRLNANLSWLSGGHAATVFLRFVGSFIDDENCVTPAGSAPVLASFGITCTDFASVDSHTTVDLQYSYTFDEDSGPLSNTSFTFGAINVFNTDPPFVFTDSGFETRTHDPRGRLLYARAKKGF